MSGLVSQPPPSQAGPATAERLPPLGRPVRRRKAVPLALAAGIALAVALVTLHDSVVYYKVDSGSMQPTLPIGSRVAVEPGVSPTVGEIVAFHAPAGAVPAIPVCGAAGEGSGFSQPCGVATPATSRQVFVKRIVAAPGALVSLRNGRAIVDGVVSREPTTVPCASVDCNFPTPVRVPAGSYYVLGDNRGDSDDSRFWGPVPASAILGVLVSCGPLQTACQPLK